MANTTKILNEIEDLIHKIDDLDKIVIKQRLEKVVFLIGCGQRECPRCGETINFVKKLGKQLFVDARYDAAETVYNVCPDCNYFEPRY